MDNMQEVGEFDTIFTFWQYWNHFPHADPASLFEDPDTKMKVIVEGLNKSIEAIGVFQDSISPAWEDPINAQGCDLCIRRYQSDFHTLKELWEKLVLSVIGETLPHNHEIAGCRVVDKKQNYKFELWLKTDILQANDEKLIQIKSAFSKLFGVPLNHISLSSHKKV